MENTFHMLLYRAFHAQRNYLRPFLDDIGLGSGQPKLIAYLAEKGPCHQRQLADYFEVDPAAICRMLDSLEKGGFIVRQVDRSNRRAGLVGLTDKGISPVLTIISISTGNHNPIRRCYDERSQTIAPLLGTLSQGHDLRCTSRIR